MPTENIVIDAVHLLRELEEKAFERIFQVWASQNNILKGNILVVEKSALTVEISVRFTLNGQEFSSSEELTYAELRAKEKPYFEDLFLDVITAAITKAIRPSIQLEKYLSK